MADGRGVTSFAAIKPGTTWGTAVQCGASDGLRIASSSGAPGKEVVPDLSLTGKWAGNAPQIGQEGGGITTSGDFRFGANCDRLLAGIMGTAGAPAEVEAALEYTHALSFIARLVKFFSYAELKGDVSSWEYPSVMISKLTIEISGKGPATMEADLLVSNIVTDDSGANTISTMGSVTIPANITPAYLGDCRFRINAEGGGALASGDTVKPDLIRIIVDRGLSEAWLADQTLGKKMAQPVEEGDVSISLQIGFPEYLATTYRDYVDAKTALKADLFITGPALPGAASALTFEYDIDFPNLIGNEHPENVLTGPQRIEDGIVFKCLQSDSAPTGMTTTDPFACIVRNQNSSNLLT
jgi:hypothetical protein